jgi:hypothetical protein
MNMNTMTKKQLRFIVQHITGNGGDIARISLDQYRRIVKSLRRSNEDHYQAAVEALQTHGIKTKADRIAELEQALRQLVETAEIYWITDESTQWPALDRARAALGAA